MRKNLFEKLKMRTGSATVEAVVAFAGFLLTIFTVLSMANFCRTQMLISSAVDATAKELAQYSYFYKMSGLQKFEGKLDEKASVGKGHVNTVIGTVDGLYTSVAGAKEQTQEDITNLANATANGDFSIEDIEQVIAGMDGSYDNIEQSFTQMSAALEDVGDNPMLYMRSLVAIAGSEALDLAKRALAVPLAKMFFSKHFGGSSEVDSQLEALGIEGGLDSMNFKLSKLFCDDDHEDIEIVVYYKIKLFKVFDLEIFEATLCKEAVCRAWLGGDNVQEYVNPTEAGTIPPETEADPSNPSNPSNPTDPSNPTGPTEPSNPTEPSEPTEPEDTDDCTEYWAMSHAARTAAFDKLLKDQRNLDVEFGMFGYDKSAEQQVDMYGNIVFKTWWTSSMNVYNDWYVALTKTLDLMMGGEFKNEKDEVLQIQTFFVYLYVPENIPSNLRSQMKDGAELLGSAATVYLQQNYPEKAKGVFVIVMLKEEGGNYDFEYHAANGGDHG